MDNTSAYRERHNRDPRVDFDMQANAENEISGRDFRVDFNTNARIIHLEPGQSITIFVKEPMDVMVHRQPIEVLENILRQDEP